MEPVSLIAGALVAGAVAASEDVATQAVRDAYNGLKELIIRRFGKNGDLGDAVEKAEQKPDSKGRQETLREELKSAEVHKDSEVLRLAQVLAEALKETSEGKKVFPKFGIQAENIQGLVQAEKIDTLTQNFGDKQ